MSDLIPGTCNLCDVKVDGIFEHLATEHPEVFAEGIARWPDGEPVVIDSTLEPEDFSP